MATYEELMKAARAADSAGDEAAARRFLEMAAQSQSAKPTPNPDGTYGQPPEGFVLNPKTGQMEDLRSPNNPNVFTGRAAAVGLGAGQGFGYDFLDEAAGMGRPYETAVMRESDRRAKEEYPGSYYIPKTAAAIWSSLGLGKALKMGQGGNLMANAKDGAKLGALEGLLFGAGQGEGLADRAKGALTYGAAGGAIGGAAPFVVEGGRQLIDKALLGPVASMRSAPNATRASKAVRTAINRSGLTPQELDDALKAAAREGQPEYVLADALGNPGQRMLSGIARTPNNARREIVEFLESRQDTQGERVARFLSTAMDAPDTAAAREAALTAARDKTAKTAYEAASTNAGPVNLNDTIELIDKLMKRDPIIGESELSKGPLGRKLQALRDRMAGSNSQLIDYDTVLGIKQDIYKQIAKGNSEKEIRDVYGALDAALENSSDGYRAANDGYRAASKVIEAVDAGRAADSSRVRSEDVVAQFGKLTPDEQAAYKVGRVDPVIARVDSAAPGVNKARTLASGKVKDEFGVMANDPAKFNRQVARENTMFETKVAATGGSKTTDNTQDVAEMSAFDYGPIVNLLRGDPKNAALQLGPTILNSLQGRNMATRELIARALLSKDPVQAIQPALRAAQSEAQRSAIAEAFLRSLTRLTN